MRAPNACSVRVCARTHARTRSVAERERRPSFGIYDDPSTKEPGERMEEERRTPLSVAIATLLSRPSIDTRFNNDAALYSTSPDNLLSLLFIANFTPPESSRHSARVVITSGEQCDSMCLARWSTFRVIRIFEYSINPPRVPYVKYSLSNISCILTNREDSIRVTMDSRKINVTSILPFSKIMDITNCDMSTVNIYEMVRRIQADHQMDRVSSIFSTERLRGRVRGISLICSFVPFHCPARGRRRNDVSIVTATNVSGAT